VEHDDLLRYARNACERLGLIYLVVGSTATTAYGEPRFTNDIDIVIDLPADKVQAFCEAFPSNDFYVSSQAVAQAVAKKFQFNVIHPTSGLKIDFIVLSDSDFDRTRSERRRQLPALADGPTWFASPEDVILKKMLYFREGGSDKHLRDIAGVVRLQADRLDRNYVAKWSKLLGVEAIWQSIVAKEREAP
jgi:hypothetical protein